MGPEIQRDESIRESFSQHIHGEVLQPDDERCDEVRTAWNAMIDKDPAVIVRCTGAADVIAAVNFAREHDLLLSAERTPSLVSVL